MMFITIGTKSFNTDHVVRIDWGATKRVYNPNIEYYDHPCVLVWYNGEGGDYDEFVGRQAALFAEYMKDKGVNLNERHWRPSQELLDKYPELPADARAPEDDIPF